MGIVEGVEGMRKPFFIMMYSQSGEMIMPLVEDDESGNSQVLLFASQREAHNTARSQHYCQAFGYEIFCMGEGDY